MMTATGFEISVLLRRLRFASVGLRALAIFTALAPPDEFLPQ